MDRALESSRFPLLAGQDHRQLLSKRVTTVHNFRHEISARRNNGTSEMQPSNGIPVPLHRGETLQQYTQKFERWLAQRAQSLVKLRNDPSRERNFWFSFAYQRAEQIPERKRSIPNNAGNSCYDAEVKRVRLEEVLHVNTSGSAMATEELSSNFSLSTGVSSQEPLRGQPDYSGLGLSGGQPAPILPQRSRKEVLAQRTLTPEEFLREVLERRQNRTSYEPISKLREIPVPLYPGETVQDYEKEFRCWAYKHHETIKSLRAQPMKERGFRCQFALDKVTARSARMEPRSRTENGTLSGMDRSHAHSTQVAKILSSLHDPPLQPTTYCEAAAVNQYHFSQSGYDMESRKIEVNQSITNTVASTPLDRAHYEANVRADSTTDLNKPLPRQQKSGDVDLASNESELCSGQPSGSDLEPGSGGEYISVVGGDEQLTATMFLPESLPSWAALLIDRVGKLERQATSLQREVRILQLAAGSRSNSHGDVSCAKPSDDVECVGNEGDEKKGIADVEPPETFIREANGDDDHEGLTPSSHFSTKESSEMRRLAKTYCYLANQVTVNEMAIDDALAYVKETKGAGDSHAMERRNQIMKLVASINKEKHKRSGALVDLLVHGLCGEEQKLISFLQEELSTTHRSNAKHDNLVEISLQLEEKYTELDKLETQFSDQVQLVSTLPPSVTEAGKALRLKKLREVSGNILKEQTERDVIKKKQRDILLCFARGGDETRKLMKEFFLKS